MTLFPELFPGPLGGSIVGRALRAGLLELEAVDLRRYAHDERGTVDEKPYGGGPGMLMKVDVLGEAIDDLRGDDAVVLLTSPRGERFTQRTAEELSRYRHLVFVCGHYEGVDERVCGHFIDREVSLGDFVLTSGNLAAMAMIDSIARLLPGVLGDDASSEDESFSAELLEYPQYTRPERYRSWAVPEVLLSGNHAGIAQWRRERAEALTRLRRPDLWKIYQNGIKNRKTGGK